MDNEYSLPPRLRVAGIREIPLTHNLAAYLCCLFLVGEFAARYGETYAKAREGVVIVPGMEVYIENWLGLSMGVPVE